MECEVKGFNYGDINSDSPLYDVMFSALCNTEKDMYMKAWFFVFIYHDNSLCSIMAHNPLVMEFKSIYLYKYMKISNAKFTLKAADPYQICAVYAMYEAPCVMLTGSWGTGKTLLSTAYALSAVDDRKIFISRPPVGINQRYDIGFFKGDKQDKMIEWCQGFLSALYYLYANTRCQQHDNNKVTYDTVRDSVFNNRFEIMPINTVQGLSMLEGDLLIVDEIQLINIDYMSMLLSRPGTGSKLILLGDLKQTYNVVKPSESGLLKLMRLMPNPNIAYVDLRVRHKGELLDVADQLRTLL
jgi:PhoH-like ATPase